MMNKSRVLFWEQLRVAGIVALWTFLVAALVMLVFRVTSGATFEGWEMLARREAARLSWAAVLLVMLYMCSAMILRQDTNAHLVADFEPRLARLPIGTVPLVFIPLAVRSFFFVALAGALWAFHGVLFGIWNSPSVFVALLGLYVLVQAVAWSWRSVGGVGYVLAALVLIAWTLAGLNGVESKDIARWLSGSGAGIAAVAGFLVCVLLGVPLALLGVHWERRDERHGLPAPSEITDTLRARGVRARRFATPLDAQVWLESRQTGNVLPAFFCLNLGALALVAAGLAHGSPNLSLIAQYVPYAAVVLAAMLTSAVAGFGLAPTPRDRSGGELRFLVSRLFYPGHERTPKTLFPWLRPIDTQHIAWARMFALVRSLGPTMLAAFVISNLALLVFGQPEVTLLREAWAHDELGVLDLLAFLITPLVLTAVLAWLALFVAELAYFFMLLALFGGLLIALISAMASVGSESGWMHFFYGVLVPSFFGCLVCTVLLLQVFRAIKFRYIGLGAAALLCAVWVALAALLAWTPGQAVVFSVVALLVSLGITALIVAPIVSLPLLVRLHRTR